MKKPIIIILGVALLYLIPSFVLQGVYGPSYGSLSGEDCWTPDNSGGWVKHGNPTAPMPTEPSVQVPVMLRYLPIFLPAVFLIVFYLTPISRKFEPPVVEDEPENQTGPENKNNPENQQK